MQAYSYKLNSYRDYRVEVAMYSQRFLYMRVSISVHRAIFSNLNVLTILVFYHLFDDICQSPFEKVQEKIMKGKRLTFCVHCDTVCAFIL